MELFFSTVKRNHYVNTKNISRFNKIHAQHAINKAKVAFDLYRL
jgi:hypothetical protein